MDLNSDVRNFQILKIVQRKHFYQLKYQVQHSLFQIDTFGMIHNYDT